MALPSPDTTRPPDSPEPCPWPPGRVLGIDHGRRRIGLAICDEWGTLATPLRQVEVTASPEATLRAIAGVCISRGVVRLVVGLPFNMDGSAGPQARVVRQFGAALAQATGLPVDYCDERLSSYAAQTALRPAALTRRQRRSRLDSVAAAVILDTWLTAHRPAPTPPQTGATTSPSPTGLDTPAEQD